ncbi:MAG: thiamine phosphate synthase [Candidatus Omnitrophica bacterium]|nr:thiamine phosphate synthase [Candidatus Omnitrophota bacterium]
MPKKNVLKKSDIYAIVDAQTCHRRNISSLLKNLIKNKVGIIQIRDKGSVWINTLKRARLAKKTIKNKALLIINDYADICILSDCDGIHLGQEDMPIETARKILGNDKIIGISCHCLKQAESAQRQGADYISFGPIFKTPLKKERKAIGLKELGEIKRKIRITFFIISGIGIKEMEVVRPLRIKRIAVCRAVCESNNLKKEIKQLRNCLN